MKELQVEQKQVQPSIWYTKPAGALDIVQNNAEFPPCTSQDQLLLTAKLQV